MRTACQLVSGGTCAKGKIGLQNEKMFPTNLAHNTALLKRFGPSWEAQLHSLKYFHAVTGQKGAENLIEA